MKSRRLDSERDAVGVPRDCQHMGFSATEMGRLASEGAYQLTERTKMDEKWMGFARHTLNTVGALLMAWGVMDEGTWTTIMGALMTLVPYVWSWMAKA